jgi:hypothetical protein
MTLMERLQKKLKPEKSRSAVCGNWFNIRLRPDIATGELLNIGVGFIDGGGRVYSRVLKDFSRLNCLYDDRIDIEDIEFIAEITENLLDRTRFSEIERLQFSPNILFSERKYAAGQSIDSIITPLFNDTVTLAWPHPEKLYDESDRFKYYNNSSVRKAVFSKLRELMGYAAEDIISKDPKYTINVGNKIRELDLPLQSSRAHVTGTIVSAWYKNLYRAEHNILKAAMDLRTAKKYLKENKFGLFVFQPDITSGLDEHALDQIEDIIDQSAWQLRMDGIDVAVESKEDDLAREIFRWHRAA